MTFSHCSLIFPLSHSDTASVQAAQTKNHLNSVSYYECYELHSAWEEAENQKWNQVITQLLAE